MINNNVFETAKQLAKSLQENFPETIVYGYIKLLLIDEYALKILLPSAEDRLDLEHVRQVFMEKNIDINLAGKGLVMCIPYIPNNEVEVKEAYEDFDSYIKTSDVNEESSNIIKVALLYAYVPIENLFRVGNTMDDMFPFFDEMKKRTYKYVCRYKSDKTKELELEKSIYEKKASDKSDNKPELEDEDNAFLELTRKYHDLSVTLLEQVKGQDTAIMKFVQGCYMGEMLDGELEKSRPKATFFFFGPPGVGKTFLAETAAKSMELPSKMFNMAEYTRDEDKDDLVGVSDFYKSAREGILVEFVRNNPNCILIFDEIEKASQNVIRIFLQMLASGKVYNVFEKTDTDFTNAIIVFTSNAGRSLYENSEENLASIPESVLLNALINEKDERGNTVFPSEMCSRLATGTTIVFNHIKIRTLNKMVENQFEKTIIAIEKKYGYKVSYSDGLSKLFLYSQGSELDARVATVQGSNMLKREIFELSKHLNVNRDKSEVVDSIRLSLDLQGVSEEIKSLFNNNGNTSFLVFASSEIVKMFPQNENISLYEATMLDSVRRCFNKEISAVFIDPKIGDVDGEVLPLSITDYGTDGIRLFHEIIESQSGIPVYILDNGDTFSETDRNTFLQEGASGIVEVSAYNIESFRRKIEQISEELYMEKQKNDFLLRGWVLDYRTKQEINNEKQATIVFYDLRKKMAIDSESRNVVLKETERPNVKFDDVIGAENAKEDLQYYIEFLKNPRQFLSSGGRVPKGVLLYGPPGTGKTMLAKAMAGESDVTFLQTSASEFKDKYIGESEANIRRIFAVAKKYAPSIIFIDEIDAIGKKRTGSENTAQTESILNALLTEMEGFTSDNNVKRPVFVLAATNFGAGDKTEGISSLDEALIRRFDRTIYVDLPTKDERIRYIKLVLGKKKIANISYATIENLANRTAGQSLAVLQNIMEIPFVKAVREKRKASDEDLLQALEEYMYGKKHEHTAEYYWEVAIHESGHAVVSYFSGDTPSYLTIESSEDFGGYMQHRSQENISKYTREDLLGKIRTSLAGRVAEEIFFGVEKSLNTGALGDLEYASQLAIQMICSYGMLDNQYMVLTRKEILNSSLAEKYINQVNELLSKEMENTRKIVVENKATIEVVAQELMKKNHLTGDEFKALLCK